MAGGLGSQGEYGARIGLAVTVKHYDDGMELPELSGGDKKSSGIERRRTAMAPGL